VGGAIHPDDLLSRLTSRQWLGWVAYVKHFLTPMQRADLNSAAIRQAAGRWKSVPKLADLMPFYGRRKRQTQKQMKDSLMAWAARDASKK
jgi:hypothetical protein